MKTIRIAHACALLIGIVCALPASAGVIYRWQDVAANVNTGPFYGYIEFSYDAWASGGHLYTSVSDIPDAGSLFHPLVGIESFFWSNPSGIGIEPYIELGLRPCSFYHQPDSCGSSGGSSTALPFTGGGGFGATFDITFGAILEGFLSVNDTSTDVRMGSSGPLWTIEHTASDGDGICHSNDGRCWGSTGLWVLDLSTIPPVRVPEPSAAALMLLGIAALFAGRSLSEATR